LKTKTNKKYYIIAGEASGDIHGANLIKALQKLNNQVVFRAWGGDDIAATGATLVKHYRNTAFMGFVEVVKNIQTIKKLFDFCKTDIQQWQPDVLILIDYPGFNLRIAEFAKNLSIKVVYYISPQVWAWKSKRVHHIKKYVDKMLVILPFEKAFYQKYNYNVDFVGHPLLDVEPANAQSSLAVQFPKPVIALLPGSRQQEIKRILPTMLKIVNRFPQYQFVVAGLSVHGLSFYQSFIKNKNVEIVMDKTAQLLQTAKAAVVTSGTATLETALYKTPQVVCYAGNPLSYQIGKQLVKVKYISLVNLIMHKEVVCELIQDDFNEKRLTQELHLITAHKTYLTKIKKDYEKLRHKLGGRGASKRAAQIIVDFVKST